MNFHFLVNVHATSNSQAIWSSQDTPIINKSVQILILLELGKTFDRKKDGTVEHKYSEKRYKQIRIMFGFTEKLNMNNFQAAGAAAEKL